MLVDHADAAGDRIGWTGDLDLLTVEQDLAFVGPREAVQDVHQCGFAGAVLAEERVDLPSTNVQADVVVGDHPGIALGDPPHLERGNAAAGVFLGHGVLDGGRGLQ